MSHQVKSKDGTAIAYDKSGQGPAVVIVGGVIGDRSQQAPVAELLAKEFTVFNFDRRAHGESQDTPPYAVEREIEDIDAVIQAAGGSAFVYGTSGPGVLALHAAAAGLGSKIKKLAIWEPPFIVDGSRPKVRSDYKAHLRARAWMVAVGLTPPLVGRLLPSTMKRLSTSWARWEPSTTERAGSEPMRAVPRRCQPQTGDRPKSRTDVAPAACSTWWACAIMSLPNRLLLSLSV